MLLCGIALPPWARGTTGNARTTIATQQHTLRRSRSALFIGAAIVAEKLISPKLSRSELAPTCLTSLPLRIGARLNANRQRFAVPRDALACGRSTTLQECACDDRSRSQSHNHRRNPHPAASTESRASSRTTHQPGEASGRRQRPRRPRSSMRGRQMHRQRHVANLTAQQHASPGSHPAAGPAAPVIAVGPGPP